MIAFLKKNRFSIIIGLIIISALSIAISMAVSCESKKDPIQDIKGIAVDEFLRDMADTREKAEDLQHQLESIRLEMEDIQGQINETAKQRVEIHRLLDDAVTIDDIDDILRPIRDDGGGKSNK
jgi:septal ring factor EnvC (AmiA/AmiB activator)